MFGVHSAMPSSVARRLCPDGGVRRRPLPPLRRGEHEAPRHLRVGHPAGRGDLPRRGVPRRDRGASTSSATAGIAGRHPRRVGDELHLSCSVGVGRSKLMAKLASKAAKPVADRSGIEPGPGVVVVPPGEELGFLHPLPVRALWGVGPVTGRRLTALGVTTVGDLAALPPGALERLPGHRRRPPPGRAGPGDRRPRPVVPEQEAKSIGHEETFAADLWDLDELHRRLLRMVDASATASPAGRAGGPDRDRQAPVRRLHPDHPVPLAGRADRRHPGHRRRGRRPVGLGGPGQGVRLLGVSLSGFVRPQADGSSASTSDDGGRRPHRRPRAEGAQRDPAADDPAGPGRGGGGADPGVVGLGDRGGRCHPGPLRGVLGGPGIPGGGGRAPGPAPGRGPVGPVATDRYRQGDRRG